MADQFGSGSDLPTQGFPIKMGGGSYPPQGYAQDVDQHPTQNFEKTIVHGKEYPPKKNYVPIDKAFDSYVRDNK